VKKGKRKRTGCSLVFLKRHANTVKGITWGKKKKGKGGGENVRIPGKTGFNKKMTYTS